MVKLKCIDGTVRNFEIARCDGDYFPDRTRMNGYSEARCSNCKEEFGVHDLKILKPIFRKHICKRGENMKQYEKKIKIIEILNHLKDVINPALNNDIYQLWVKTDKKIPFRKWCIDKIKDLILMELDK